METLLQVALFVVCLFVIELLRHGFSRVHRADARRVQKRLATLKEGVYGDQPMDILRKRRLSDIGWLNRVLLAVPGILRIERLMIQANLGFPLGVVVLSSLLFLIGGTSLGSLLTKSQYGAMAVGLGMGYLPLFYVRLKKRERMKRFERQLPDALELIARTLRAGHAFSGGMKMVADEFDDPVGTEFRRTLDEINFGVSVTDALKGLTERVDCSDLKYFVVSVIIQRETGGNLAEIIDSMAYIIRERFKLLGKIRVLSAEGKFSAVILCALPFLMALVIFFLNRNFIDVLREDPAGKVLAGVAIILMIFGILVMRQMIRIRV